MNQNEAEQPIQKTMPTTKAIVCIVKPHQFDSKTPQTPGMQRVAAISQELAGSQVLALWIRKR